MPPRWIHELIDLLAWGQSYWQVHRDKDRPWEQLGQYHRAKNHLLYQEAQAQLTKKSLREVLGWMVERAKDITEDDWDRGLSPDEIEQRQAYFSHDIFDLSWSNLNDAEKRDWAATFRDIILHPENYGNLFTPEDCREVLRSHEYLRLREYVNSRSVPQLLYRAK